MWPRSATERRHHFRGRREVSGFVSDFRALARRSEQGRSLCADGGAVKIGDDPTAIKGARVDRVADILETLASLGQARALPGSRFVAP